MRLKMLIGISGQGFSLSPGEETDRFGEKEAKRLIAADYAEKAPPVERKKPETKKEWDDERASLVSENEELKAEVAAGAEREAALLARVDTLGAFHGSVSTAMQAFVTTAETMEKAGSQEKRG